MRSAPLHGAAAFGVCSLILTVLACSGENSMQTVTMSISSPTSTPPHQLTPVPTTRVMPTSVPTTFSETVAPSPTSMPTPTRTPVPTYSPTATATPITTPDPTPTPIPTQSPTAEPSPTREPVAPTTAPTSTPEPTESHETSYFVVNDDCNDLAVPNRLPTITITVRYTDIQLHVEAELADDPVERGQGLMCRSVVPDNTGMLFEFGSESTHGFWMYNTYVPLDIIYLNSERLAVHALTMSPCPRPTGADDAEWHTKCVNESGQYGTKIPALYALELPSGWLDRVGIPLGKFDEVEFSW